MFRLSGLVRCVHLNSAHLIFPVAASSFPSGTLKLRHQQLNITKPPFIKKLTCHLMERMPVTALQGAEILTINRTAHREMQDTEAPVLTVLDMGLGLPRPMAELPIQHPPIILPHLLVRVMDRYEKLLFMKMVHSSSRGHAMGCCHFFVLRLIGFHQDSCEVSEVSYD